ncbi:MAG TPA: hypothetical protein VIX19_03690 [Terriglobales bacterium]
MLIVRAGGLDTLLRRDVPTNGRHRDLAKNQAAIILAFSNIFKNSGNQASQDPVAMMEAI